MSQTKRAQAPTVIASYKYGDTTIEVVESGDIFLVDYSQSHKVAKIDLSSVNPTRSNLIAIIESNYR